MMVFLSLSPEILTLELCGIGSSAAQLGKSTGPRYWLWQSHTASLPASEDVLLCIQRESACPEPFFHDHPVIDGQLSIHFLHSLCSRSSRHQQRPVHINSGFQELSPILLFFIYSAISYTTAKSVVSSHLLWSHMEIQRKEQNSCSQVSQMRHKNVHFLG